VAFLGSVIVNTSARMRAQSWLGGHQAYSHLSTAGPLFLSK